MNLKLGATKDPTAMAHSQFKEDGQPTSRPEIRRWGTGLFRFPRGSLLVIVATLIIWQVSSLLSFVVPSPGATFKALVVNFSDEAFVGAVAKTGGDALLAFVLSVLVGVVLGSVIGLVRPVGRVLEPAILSLNGVPKIALYPMLLLLFGLGNTSQIAMGFIFGVFPVTINFAGGLIHVPSIYGRVAQALAMPKHVRLRTIDIPAALPSLAVGLRLAFSLSLVGVVFAEIIASRGGLGQVIIAKYTLAQYELMGAAVLLLMATALLGTSMMRALERRLSERWRTDSGSV